MQARDWDELSVEEWIEPDKEQEPDRHQATPNKDPSLTIDDIQLDDPFEEDPPEEVPPPVFNNLNSLFNPPSPAHLTALISAACALEQLPKEESLTISAKSADEYPDHIDFLDNVSDLANHKPDPGTNIPVKYPFCQFLSLF